MSSNESSSSDSENTATDIVEKIRKSNINVEFKEHIYNYLDKSLKNREELNQSQQLLKHYKDQLYGQQSPTTEGINTSHQSTASIPVIVVTSVTPEVTLDSTVPIPVLGATPITPVVKHDPPFPLPEIGNASITPEVTDDWFDSFWTDDRSLPVLVTEAQNLTPEVTPLTSLLCSESRTPNAGRDAVNPVLADNLIVSFPVEERSGPVFGQTAPWAVTTNKKFITPDIKLNLGSSDSEDEESGDCLDLRQTNFRGRSKSLDGFDKPTSVRNYRSSSEENLSQLIPDSIRELEKSALDNSCRILIPFCHQSTTTTWSFGTRVSSSTPFSGGQSHLSFSNYLNRYTLFNSRTFGQIQQIVTNHGSNPFGSIPRISPSYLPSSFGPTVVRGHGRNTPPGRMNQSLTAQDLTDISNIITNSSSTGTQRKRFNGNTGEAIQWLESFENLARARGWSDDKKKNEMGCDMEGPALEWYALEVKGKGLNWTNVKRRFHEQFLPVGYEQQLRRDFRTRKQQLFESSANYICAMRAILSKINAAMPEAEAVESIISNMLPQIAEKLIIINPKTYADLRRGANLVEQSLRTLSEGNEGQLLSIAQSLNQLKLESEEKPKPQLDYNRRSDNFSSRTTRGAPRCYNCGRIGHMQAMCRSRPRKFLNGRQNFTRDYNQDYGRNFNRNSGRGFNRNSFSGVGNSPFSRYRRGGFRRNDRRFGANMVQAEPETPDQQINVLNIIGNNNNYGFYINVVINSKQTVAIIDSGAAATFMSFDYATKGNFPIAKWTGKGYRLANGSSATPVGETKVKLSVTLKDETKTFKYMPTTSCLSS